MRYSTFVAAAMLAAAPLTPVFAWGSGGHEVIGAVGAGLLTPAAEREAEALLQGEQADRRSLAAASTWADEIRPRRRETAAWHFVNVSIRDTGYDAARDCANQDCVVARVEEFRGRLADRALVPAVRLEALKFLVHFVGDMHQPLHVGENDDRGGNDLRVRFQGHNSNLHKVWDTEILNVTAFRSQNEADYAANTLLPAIRAMSSEARAAWEQGGAVEWANEGHAVSRDTIYAELGGTAPVGGSSVPVVLRQSYADDHLPALETQLKRAGVRLALVLNEALD